MKKLNPLINSHQRTMHMVATIVKGWQSCHREQIELDATLELGEWRYLTETEVNSIA